MANRTPYHQPAFQRSNATILVVLLFLLAVTVVACSPRTLNFFFDGVPDPSKTNSLAARTDSLSGNPLSGQGGTANIDSAGIVYVHPPYKKRNCSVCHEKQDVGMKKLVQSETCYQCHDNFADQYKVVHGPVAGGFCTACHSPHAATGRGLLYEKGQKLCLKCHESKDVFQEGTHSEIGEKSCLECHNPHGGDDRYLQK